MPTTQTCFYHDFLKFRWLCIKKDTRNVIVTIPILRQLAAKKKTPFLVQLKQIFDTFYYDRA